MDTELSDTVFVADQHILMKMSYAYAYPILPNQNVNPKF